MLSVLHADRDQDLCKIHADYLGARGFQVHTAQGRVDCVQKLRRFAPDLLILDLELPWGGSEGVLAIMREDVQLRRIPVVMTSAETLNGFTGGVEATSVFLRKPFSPTCLLEKIRTTLNGVSKVTDDCARGPVDSAGGDITVCLAQEIQMRTGRRVQDLLVGCNDGLVSVRGHVRSFHAKQLVLVAAMRYLAGRGLEVVFDVNVD